MTWYPIRCAVTVIAALSLVACGGTDSDSDDDDDRAAATPAAPTAGTGGAATPAADGKVVTVEMITDEKGNYFQPANFEVHRGDVIRFVLKSGVHNVHFLADSNPGRSGLPAASPMLQLPGQTHDVVVSFAEGLYYYQCDPHALLGMVGRIEVEDEDDDD
ncbi:MAG TPA: plastocyanin/azurin family copper-binding protein [Gemmatimonadaceae bacterium]|nr:plastocyanin/azurin family copper-binding protein [Gemmatimonadaceae bacterium]